MTAPSDRAAEMTVLGAAMNSPTFASELDPADFYDMRNAAIFRAVLELRVAGDPCDPVPVAANLARSGDLDRIGGTSYLFELFSAPTVSVASPWHVKRVQDLAQQRRAIEGGTRLAQLASAADANPESIAAAAAELAAQLGDKLIGTGGPTRWDMIVEETNDALDAAANSDGVPTGVVQTGLIDLDRLLSGGLRPGQLMIVAARPGLGKTVVATDLCRSSAFRQSVPTALWSLEMSRVEVAKRILSAQYRIPYHHLTSARLSDDEWVRLANASRADSEAPLWIDDTSKQTLASIRAAATRLHRSEKLGLAVVDYLQLIDASSGRKNDNRQQEVSNLSRGLKLMARELDIPVVFLAQLNRGPEQRQDKRPQLADLRESGSLEQDADIVVLIHRDDAYEKECPRAGEVDLIVAKNRGGPTDVITVAGQLHFQRFVDMAVGS